MEDDAEFRGFTGAETRDQFAEIEHVYTAAFPHSDLDDYRRRVLRQMETAGFAAVVARVHGRLAGFVYGLPLAPSTRWWNGLEPPAPAGFTTETGDRTFAVIDLAVRPLDRGRGLGRSLIERLLASRPEERSTLATNPHDQEVQGMYERWGWVKAGRTPGLPGETEPAFDLYVIALHGKGWVTRSR